MELFPCLLSRKKVVKIEDTDQARSASRSTGYALSSVEGRVAMEFFDVSGAGQAKKFDKNSDFVLARQSQLNESQVLKTIIETRSIVDLLFIQVLFRAQFLLYSYFLRGCISSVSRSVMLPFAGSSSVLYQGRFCRHLLGAAVSRTGDLYNEHNIRCPCTLSPDTRTTTSRPGRGNKSASASTSQLACARKDLMASTS